ncbi:InlB B-repeat-containing protein [Petrocella sp. FN5]|uniref:InlB B-repeat-containing protein n=1 Tax=Petrocella sp. FN5 TaxID=3032002 RepID=UPI0023DA5235|nr:hypothetical protein [Petrocella sp. FN5]MDF1617938.1 hypothetical protein [Petrocella sp. FN5]
MKKMKKVLSLAIALSLMFSSMNVVNAETEPATPTLDIATTPVDETSAEASWSVTFPDGSYILDGYDYQLSGKGKVKDVMTTSAIFNGLTAGTVYSLTVDAHYSIVEDEQSTFEVETKDFEVETTKESSIKNINIWRREIDGITEYALSTSNNSTRYETVEEALEAALEEKGETYESLESYTSLEFKTNEGEGWEKSEKITVVVIQKQTETETRYRVKGSEDEYSTDLDEVVKNQAASYEYDEWIIENDDFVYTVMLVTKDFVSKTVEVSLPVNLWMAADDGARLYIDGQEKAGLLKKWNAPSNYNKANLFYIHDLSSNPFLAAKAWDGHELTGKGDKTIAGFKMVLEVRDERYSVTDEKWYYYTGKGEPEEDAAGNFWYEEDYMANSDLWTSVTVIENPNGAWAKSDAFPADGDYIWTPSYLHSKQNKIDTPVYFRNAPTQVPIDYFDIKITPIIKERTDDSIINNPIAGSIKATFGDTTVQSSGNTINASLPDGTIITFEAIASEGYRFVSWLYNLNNELDEGDDGYRPNPREIKVSSSSNKFGPTPVFEVAPPVVDPTFTVLAITEQPGMGTTSPSEQTVEADGSATVTAEANSGFIFIHWTDGESIVSTDASYTVEGVQSDMTFYAVFDEDTEPNNPEPRRRRSTPEPEQEEETETEVFLDLEDEATPEALPEEEVVEPVVAIEILDEEIPEADGSADVELPKTSGIPIGIYYGLGIAVSGLGFKIKKRS